MTPAAGRAPGWLRWAVAAAAVAHLALVVRFFPPAVVFGGHPVTHGDWPLKFTEAYLVGQGGELPFRTWAYSPAHLAGYPAGVYTGVGTQSYDLAVLAARGLLPPVTAFHLWLLALFTLPPFLPAVAARLAGLSPAGVWLSVLLGLFVWHLESRVRYMWSFGTTSFTTGSALSVCVAVLYGRMLSVGPESLARATGRAVAVGVMAGVVVNLHPLCGFVLAAVCGWPAVVGAARVRVRFLGLSAAAAGVCVALNAHWLVPFARLKADGYIGGAPGPFGTSARHLLADLLDDRGYRRTFDPTVGLQVVGLLAAFGLVRWGVPGVPRGQWLVGLGGVLAIAYLGSYSPAVHALQPYRFVAAAVFIALLPAAAAAERLAAEVAGARRNLFLLAASVALVGPRFYQPAYQAVSPPPLRGLPREERDVVEWIGAHTDGRSRLMLEPSMNAMADILPAYLVRETICGPYDHVVLAHRSAIPSVPTSDDPTLTWFGRPVSELTEREWAERLRVLNVEWLVVRAGGEWDGYACRLAGVFRPAADVGPYRVYRVPACDRSFLLAGTGVAEAGPNVIRLTGLSPGRVTLKYHYLSTLEADNGAVLEREHVLGDPVGFITFDNPGQAGVVIRNTYRYR